MTRISRAKAAAAMAELANFRLAAGSSTSTPDGAAEWVWIYQRLGGWVAATQKPCFGRGPGLELVGSKKKEEEGGPPGPALNAAPRAQCCAPCITVSVLLQKQKHKVHKESV